MPATWYDAAWTNRIPVKVRNTSGGTSADIEVDVSAYQDWDEFWDLVDEDGDDIRVTMADGYTLVDYDLASFSASARTGTIEVDSFAFGSTTNRTYVFYIYWGNAAASAAKSTFTPSSALSGLIYHGRPSPAYKVTAGPTDPDAENPSQTVVKATGEDVRIWFSLEPVLEKRLQPSADRDWYEGVLFIDPDVELSGSSQASLFDEDGIRVVEDDDGLWVGIYVTAGADGTTYTVTPSIGTTVIQGAVNRTLNPRCLLYVVDAAE